jgi:hypothetical protein
MNSSMAVLLKSSLYVFCFSSLLAFSTNAFSQSQTLTVLIPDADADNPNIHAVHRDSLKKHLYILASDSLEGRETGSPGIKKAAEYIVKEFKKYGIKPISTIGGYEQKVAFTWTSWKEIALKINGIEYKHLWDFIAVSAENNSIPELKSDQIMFLGYGIDDPVYSDYSGVDTKNKVVLIYKGEPVRKDGTFWISGTSVPSEWNNNIDKKAEAAYKHGAKLVLVIEDDIKKHLETNRRKILGNAMSLGLPDATPIPRANVIQISTNIAKDIIGKSFKKLVKKRDKINKKGKPENLVLNAPLEAKMEKNVKVLEGSNILAYIEGEDEKLKNELVIVTAHYDHLGKKGDDVYNGADDNGSGTVTVMELVRVISRMKSEGMGARRSILLMLVTGEEKGLLGSEYYVNHPIFPLEQSIANVNIDMIGRVDEKHAANPEYIYVIGSDRLSTELHNINEEMNKRYTNLELDYTYNAESDPNRYYYRSDHYNFAERGIPAIFYFSGTHPDYHRPGDTVDKINFERMETIGKLVFHVIWDLANRDERIKVDVEVKSKP